MGIGIGMGMGMGMGAPSLNRAVESCVFVWVCVVRLQAGRPGGRRGLPSRISKAGYVGARRSDGTVEAVDQDARR